MTSESHIHLPGESPGRQPWLRSVDFSEPSALAPDQQARLRKLVDDFGAIVSVRTLAELGLAMQLSSLWTRELPWREAQPMPSDESVTTTIACSGGGSFFLTLDSTLASLVVERMLGTEPDPARPLRAVTTIDRALLSRLLDLLMDTLGELWSEATGTTIRSSAVSPHGGLGMAAELMEPTLMLAIEVRLFSTYSIMYLLVPQSAIDPVAAQLSRPSARASGEDPVVTAAVHARLGEADVDVQVQLGAVRLTAGEIADLHPGDQVPLPTAASEAAALLVDGVPVQFGHVGRSGGRRAVRIGQGPA